MRTASSLATALGLYLGLAGCAAAGAKSFQRGESASKAGDLDAAASAYKAALQAEPQNAAYKAALTRTQKELASQHEAVARQREKSGDWKGASESWSRASQLVPDDQDLKARKELSGLKALDLGPDEWFEAVRKVSATIPGSSIVEKSLAGARTKACQHHVVLGDRFLSSNEGTKAVFHYDRAKEIEPSAPGLDPARYDEASAFMLMEQGDAKLAAGVSIEAYELYQKAFEKKPLPELKSKLAKVKAKAQPVLTKLEAARALSERGKSLEALKIYESLQGTPGLASLEAEVERVRAEVAREETEKARAHAASGDLTKAQRSLADAIRSSSLESAVLEGMTKAAQEIQEGRPGKGYRTLEGMRAAVKDGLFAAVKAVALASAKKILEKAQSISKKDAGAALASLSDLGPFEDEIPSIRELRRTLRAGTFQETLDAALRVAKTGDDAEAAELLLAALGTSSAPQPVRDAATLASGALKAAKYAEAEMGFQKCLTLEPRSKLASRGVEIARLRRREAEKQALQALKSGAGEDARAVSVLAAGLRAEPDDADARQGAEVLLERIESNGKRWTDVELATLLALASRLVDAPAASMRAFDEGRASLEKGDHAAAERAFAKALESAPQLRMARVARDLSRQRAPAASTSVEKKSAGGGDDPADPDQARAALKKALETGRQSPEAKSAIDGAMQEVEKRLALGDEKSATRLLLAVVEAAGEVKELSGAIIRFESGKYDDAETELARSSSDLAKRIGALVRQRKLQALKAGLSGEDRVAGESIRALLQADPNSKEGLAAFARLLDKARSAASRGDDKATSEALQSACIAQGASEELSIFLRAGATKLGEKMYAEAERQYLDALRLAADSGVAKAGAEIAKQGRIRAEKAALEALSTPSDPSPHARTLLASIAVDSGSKVVAKALALLLARAEKASKKADDVEAARSLEAAAVLENLGSDVAEGSSKANALLAQSSFAEAEAAYSGLLAAQDGVVPRRSKVAETGRALARARRIAVLRDELEAAKREGDVLRQSRAVQKILEIDRSDTGALAISKKLRSAVIESRLSAAKSQRELGRPGVAYLYLKRVLELDPANGKANSDLQSVAGALKTRLDLVVVVDRVARATSLPEHACRGIEEPLRSALMTDGSKRDDLGAYILSPDWTKAVERSDKEAPEVSGKLKATLSKCEHGAAVGRLTLLWQLAAPIEAEPFVKGVIETDLPGGLIPRDEQDGEGKNAKSALAQRASKALFEKLSEDRGAVDLWLLAAAEHGIKVKDAALVADAYARLSIKRPVSIDPVRVSLVEQYLDAEFK